MRIGIAGDYPDFVIPLTHTVSAGHFERDLAVCGSGVGACGPARIKLSCAEPEAIVRRM